ncbi:MAG: hypothetical protein HDS04_07020 [Bacteroides sp.]|nr:hypothetical protein [Bacteroides sp.]
MKEWTPEMTAENLRRNAALSAVSANPLAPSDRWPSEAERLNEDFEYWAARCARIKHKLTGRRVPFVLNNAQRKVLNELERQRRAGLPMRLIVLKSRQWGCSTLVCHYLMWLQTRRHENWHSLICAHQKSAATVLSGQINDIVRNFPPELDPPRIVSYNGLRSVRELLPGGSRLTVCTTRNPDAARGADYMMAHLSEVAYWPSRGSAEASELVRSVCSSVPRVAESVVIMESTANGPGNYFHSEWQRALAGESDKTALFATWHEVEYNRERLILPPAETWERLTDYERALWEPPLNLTLEQIFWYHNQTRAQGGRQAMMREHPTTPDEAFSNTALAVFDPADLSRLRPGADTASPRRYELDPRTGLPVATPSGRLEIWAHPCPADQLRTKPAYVIAVDVGGCWEGADWSVIAVFDVRTPGQLEVVAQWRGHVHIDRLCALACALGRYYHRALLIFESNTLETRGTHALEKLGRSGYPNLYRRQAFDTVTNTMSTRIGFHTNAATKAAAIFELTYALRDGRLIERSAAAIDEMATYIRRGEKTEAAHGCHDDMLMTRAIAAYALAQSPPRPLKSLF